MLRSPHKPRIWIFVAGILLLVVWGAGKGWALSVIDTSHGDIGTSKEKITYVSDIERIPDTPDVAQIEETIKKAWTLRLEAGLDSNKEHFDVYKEQLAKYYSNKLKRPSSRYVFTHQQSMLTPPEEKKTVTGQINRVLPLEALPSNASELSRQLALIENGRLNEELGHFQVISFGVKKFEFKKVEVEGNEARVIVDIVYWSRFVHENPDGTVITSTPTSGEQHRIYLVKDGAYWKINDDVFTFIPGYEP